MLKPELLWALTVGLKHLHLRRVLCALCWQASRQPSKPPTPKPPTPLPAEKLPAQQEEEQEAAADPGDGRDGEEQGWIVHLAG